MKRPDDHVWTNGDLANYAEIMVKPNSLRIGNDYDNMYPKANKGWKWKYLLKTYGMKDNNLKVRERL